MRIESPKSLPELQGCETVQLEEMLDARERRVQCQQRFLGQYGGTLICLTLNIAGPYKVFPLEQQTFREAMALITDRLSQEKVFVVHFEEHLAKTGSEAFFSVQKNAGVVKRWMAELEESCPVGRLFDIDVLKTDGTKVSRTDIGIAGRKCLLCDRPSAICARSRAHTASKLTARTISVMRDHFREKVGDRVSACAARALLYEVSVTPKPGLVDRSNNGSHSDMDFFLFMDSTIALVPYFRKAAQLGFDFSGTPCRMLVPLRTLGVQAEKTMFSATGGVNTHKGAIFSLGILCAAAGRLFRSGQPLTEAPLFSLGAQIALPAMKDFRGVTAENAKTSSERLFALYGFTGVRGETAAGFPSVRKFALPVLRSQLAGGSSKDEAGTIALLYLMANVCDTTTFHRSSMADQRRLCQNVKTLLSELQTPAERTAAAWQLDTLMQQRGLSVGGCADLLAVAWMTLFLEDSEQQAPHDITQYAVISANTDPYSASLSKSRKR